MAGVFASGLDLLFKKKEPLFWTDSITLCCSDVETEKQFWMQVFDCKQVRAPKDRDDPLPSDVALKLPGDDMPRILLSDQEEVEKAGFERPNDHCLVFTKQLEEAREYLMARGVAVGPIQENGGTESFEIHDPDGTVIEVCREP